MTYIFGYGSLIFAGGINGRGMSRIYKESDLIECKLLGYKREFNAVCWGNRFLGIKKSYHHDTNGIIFPVSETDLVPFKKSEGGDSAYEYRDVTENILCKKLPKDCTRILTCVTKNPSNNGQVPKYYFNVIEEGLTFRTSKFLKEFYMEDVELKQTVSTTLYTILKNIKKL